MSIKAGDRMPTGTFKTTAADGRRDVTTDELFKARRWCCSPCPGRSRRPAMPSICRVSCSWPISSRRRGVDTVACFAVNDVFVMNAWGKQSNVGDKVLMLADGNGDYAAPSD